jgi:hypothetical protein
VKWNKLVVQLSVEDKRAIRRIAKLRASTMSQVVRDMIRMTSSVFTDCDKLPTHEEVRLLWKRQLYARFVGLVFGGEPTEPMTEKLCQEIDEILAEASNTEPLSIKVLRCRQGLDDGVTKTLQEVGYFFDLTRERVLQLEKQALRRLRHPRFSRRLEEIGGGMLT